MKLIRQRAKIVLARQSFWDFCKVLAPDFYRDDREHLLNLCNALENFYSGLLMGPNGPYRKLIIHLPPQHGKSRTLINFYQWVLGLNKEERIINCSYNDTTAAEFARYTRDGIQLQKNDQYDVVYSDIFPDSSVEKGNASYQKWALAGEHFNYLGAGVGGSITSKGATILGIDDPVKGAIEALNENHLEKIWIWYSSTFLSRRSAEGGEPLQIITCTPWSKNDIAGRILDSDEADEWYVVKMPAYDSETDQMLCPDLLSKKALEDIRRKMMPEIFQANYMMERVDIKGRLYSSFKTYESAKVNFEKICNYTDTADQGNDFTCSITYGVYENQAYVIDVVYTAAPMEETEPATAKMLHETGCNSAKIESNSGGRGFLRQVRRLLKEVHNNHKCVVNGTHQTQNKRGRIISNSAVVMERVYMPANWNVRWPKFHEDLMGYQKDGKNAHDDAPDALTGVVESITSGVRVMQ